MPTIFIIKPALDNSMSQWLSFQSHLWPLSLARPDFHVDAPSSSTVMCTMQCILWNKPPTPEKSALSTLTRIISYWFLPVSVSSYFISSYFLAPAKSSFSKLESKIFRLTSSISIFFVVTTCSTWISAPNRGKSWDEIDPRYILYLASITFCIKKKSSSLF